MGNNHNHPFPPRQARVIMRNMVMLGNNSSRRASSRSARLSPSISHTVSTRQQRPQPSPTLNRQFNSHHTRANLAAQRLKTRKQNHQRARIKRKKLALPEFLLLGAISTSAICIAVSLITVATFDPVRDAENALTTLADDYYIEFLYPRVLGSHINSPATILAKYTESGLPSVRLSQMLLYNNASHASYNSYFDNPYYKCDAGHSYLSFYPVQPYGPHDYTVKYVTSCEKLAKKVI